ncbi:MAG: ATP-binding protein [Bdellovibrionales bacterium]|nr:ATP-binding protein [Bdellovibrionales bacterium]
MAEPVNSKSVSSRLPKEPLVVAALIVAVSVAIAVGGIVFKTRDSLSRDRVELLADANAKQVAPLRRVVQQRLAQDRTRLIQFAGSRAVQGPGRVRFFGDFAMVAMLVPSAGGQWSLSWIEKGPLYTELQNDKVMISQDQELSLLRSIPFDRIREGDLHWQRLSDASGRPVWSMAVSVETQAAAAGSTPTTSALPEGTDYQSVQVGTGGRAVVVGFFGRNPLLSATEDFIGSSSTAFVIDSRGYAATHSNKVMIGALLKDDPSVKEVFSARSSAGATRYQTAGGAKIFSAFEQVDRSNLYVVMATADNISGAAGQSFGKTAITTGVLAIVVGLILVFAWGGQLIPRVTSPSPRGGNDDMVPPGDYIRGITGDTFGRPDALRAPAYGGRLEVLEMPEDLTKQKSFGGANATSDAGEEKRRHSIAVQQEKSAYTQKLVEGLEKTMREPLLAAMAHVQLLKSKAGDTPNPELMVEISEHVSSVDRDLRRAKELIDHLATLSSVTPPGENEKVELRSVVQSAMDGRKAKLDEDGIKLSLKLDQVPHVSGREESVRNALTEIVENARRALSGRSSKVITVKLEDGGESVMLTVSDNGVGMNRDTRAQAFEPFFREFDHPDSRGLGLSTVKSMMQSQGGTAEIASSPGEGTSLICRWPVSRKDREAFETKAANDRQAATEAALAASLSVESVAGASVEPSDAMTSASAVSLMKTTADFSDEGAVALGGKTPLSGDQMAALPPPPTAEDDEDDNWSFDNSNPSLRISESISETAISRSNEPTEIVIRPVRRD